MLKVKKMEPHATLPKKAHFDDLGYDLYALEDTNVIPRDVTLVRTGIQLRFPPGYGGLIRDRSSVATRHKVFTVAGVIDEGYTGEIKVAFHSALQGWWCIKAGDKIAQLVLIPRINFDVEEVDDLGETERGEKGFGSSDNRDPFFPVV